MKLAGIYIWQSVRSRKIIVCFSLCAISMNSLMRKSHPRSTCRWALLRTGIFRAKEQLRNLLNRWRNMDKHLKQDAIIEDALQSEPLASMPRSITADVMARIQTKQATRHHHLARLWFQFCDRLMSCRPLVYLAKSSSHSACKASHPGHFALSGFSGEFTLAGSRLIVWNCSDSGCVHDPSLYKMTMDHRR